MKLEVKIKKADWNTSTLGSSKDIVEVEFPEIICKSSNKPFKWLPSYSQMREINQALAKVEAKSWDNKDKKEVENMGFEKHESESDFIKLEAGESIEGVYLGKEPSEKFPKTFNYKIENLEIGIKFISGAVIQSHFEDAKNPIKVGSRIKIIYKGKVKNYHDYDVFVWKE